MIATVLTGVGVLVAVWRLVESVRRDLTGQITTVNAQIATVNARIDDVRRDLTSQIDDVRRDLGTQIAAVNTRIDNVLLADRPRAS